MTLHPAEAPVLRRMGEMILSGHSYRDIAWWLNGNGHLSTGGFEWNKLTVRKLLENPRYGGIRRLDDQDYAGKWEPVFDRATWQRLQAVMASRRTGSPGDGSPAYAKKYLLTGIAKCGKCGMHLSGHQRRDVLRDGRKGELLPRYICRSWGDKQKAYGCGGIRRHAIPMDHFIREAIIFRLDTPELVRCFDAGAKPATKMSWPNWWTSGRAAATRMGSSRTMRPASSTGHSWQGQAKAQAELERSTRRSPSWADPRTSPGSFRLARQCERPGWGTGSTGGGTSSSCLSATSRSCRHCSSRPTGLTASCSGLTPTPCGSTGWRSRLIWQIELLPANNGLWHRRVLAVRLDLPVPDSALVVEVERTEVMVVRDLANLDLAHRKLPATATSTRWLLTFNGTPLALVD